LSTGNFTKKFKINDENEYYQCDSSFIKFEHGILKIKFLLKEDEKF